MCSNYMARLDVVNEEWHNCEGPALSRLHAGVTGSAGLLYVTGGRTQVNVVVSAVEVRADMTYTRMQLNCDAPVEPCCLLSADAPTP